LVHSEYSIMKISKVVNRNIFGVIGYGVLFAGSLGTLFLLGTVGVLHTWLKEKINRYD